MPEPGTSNRSKQKQLRELVSGLNTCFWLVTRVSDGIGINWGGVAGKDSCFHPLVFVPVGVCFQTNLDVILHTVTHRCQAAKAAGMPRSGN